MKTKTAILCFKNGIEVQLEIQDGSTPAYMHHPPMPAEEQTHFIQNTAFELRPHQDENAGILYYDEMGSSGYDQSVK